MKNDEPIELALRAAIAWNKADKTWATTTLDLAVKLKAARDWVGDDDTAFGQILEGNEWEDRNGKPLVSRHDRAALIKMGEFPEIAREVLATTDRRSPQYIWSHEIKPKAEPPPPPPPPPDLALRKDRPPIESAPPASLTISEEERAQALADAQRKQQAMAEAFLVEQVAREAQRLQEEQEATEQSVDAADAVRGSDAEAAVMQKASTQPGNYVAAMNKHGRLLDAGYPVLAGKIFGALTVAEARALQAILAESGRFPKSRLKLADALTTAINRHVQTLLAIKGAGEKAEAQTEPQIDFDQTEAAILARNAARSAEP